MNYDQWKTSNPQDEGCLSDLVTSCCGSQEESSGASNCCDSKFWAETDICGDCKEHADDYMICSDCGDDEDCYTMIEQYEYDERRHDDANEFNRDDI